MGSWWSITYMCRLQTKDRIQQKVKQNIESDWLNLAQLGLPICQFPKELLKAKYLAKVCQSPVAWLHSYTDYYFCYLQKLTVALNNPCTKHLLGGQEICYYWLKNSENSVHKLRLYTTVLMTIYNISRQLFQTTKVRSAKHQFRIIKIHTWLHLHTPLSALNELLA